MTISGRFKPDDESGRLAALRRYEILDTEPEKEFEDIVALVKSIFGVNFVAVNLIASNRQWMKAAAGMQPIECRREDAFCDHTIRGTEALAVENATDDPRFVANPFVTGEAHIRAYLGVPLTTADGYNIGALCVFDDMPRKFTEADTVVLRNFAKVVMSQMELRLVARVDSLTGTLTRRAFAERMDRAIAGDPPACLIMLDLDHFKQVNDTHGHPAGDEVLRQVAACIGSRIRLQDCLGRLGGEEFGILLAETPLAEAMALAERVRQAVAQLGLTALKGDRMTLSLGVAEHRPGETADGWFERADAALYQAKRTGRNRCVQAQDTASAPV